MAHTNPLTFIDIFAGCGGLASGLIKAGWKPLFAVEKNKDAFSTYKANLIDSETEYNWPEWLEISHHDINALLRIDELAELKGKVDLVAGGPPCQGFSTAGKRRSDDLRNKLVKSYIHFVKAVMPRALIFENVQGITVRLGGNKRQGRTSVYSEYIERALRSLGYKVTHRIIDMSDFCIPQRRRRFILVAFLGQSSTPESVFDLLESNVADFSAAKNITRRVGVADAIGDLLYSWGHQDSPDSKGFQAGVYGPAISGYQKLMRANCEYGGAVDSHRFVNHRKETVRLHYELLGKSVRGKRVKPKDAVVPNLRRRGVTVLSPVSPAPTLTSIPDELVHYSEPRILTVREYARLQSFPDDFQFKGPYTTGGELRKKEVPRYTQIGNAVPPLFGEQIGLAIKEVLINGK